MILVLCGTQKQDFSRMIAAVELVANEQEVIVQAGHNDYKSNTMKLFSFVPNETLQLYINEADLIVTHAGAGSIIQALKLRKRVIAFPRLSKYHEHVNDHQLQLASKLAQLGYLLMYEEGTSFQKLYENALMFQPKPYELGGQMLQLLDDQIEKYLNFKK